MTTQVADAPEPHPRVCRDPNDDYLLALAAKSQADLLVTGDLDLLDLSDVTPPVVTPRDLLARRGD